MVIGILQLELSIDQSRSLKDKRRVVHSLRDRLQRGFNVSIVETGDRDDHRTAVLGVALATRSVDHCQSVLDRVLDQLRTARDCHLTDHKKEILTGCRV